MRAIIMCRRITLSTLIFNFGKFFTGRWVTASTFARPPAYPLDNSQISNMLEIRASYQSLSAIGLGQ